MQTLKLYKHHGHHIQHGNAGKHFESNGRCCMIDFDYLKPLCVHTYGETHDDGICRARVPSYLDTCISEQFACSFPLISSILQAAYICQTHTRRLYNVMSAYGISWSSGPCFSLITSEEPRASLTTTALLSLGNFWSANGSWGDLSQGYSFYPRRKLDAPGGGMPRPSKANARASGPPWKPPLMPGGKNPGGGGPPGPPGPPKRPGGGAMLRIASGGKAPMGGATTMGGAW